MNKFSCQKCNKEFYSYKKTKPFCSNLCYWKSKIGKPSWNKGKKLTKEHIEKLRKAKIGYIPWNKGKTKLEFPQLSNSGVKKGHKPWNIGLKGFMAGEKHWSFGKRRLDMSGANHPNWKGGISRDIHSLATPEYKEWRLKVFTRDNYKCKINNQDCCSYIEPHHILPWRDYPELRYEINNGITLCRAHHPRKRAEEKRLAPVFQELVSVSN